MFRAYADHVLGASSRLDPYLMACINPFGNRNLVA